VSDELSETDPVIRGTGVAASRELPADRGDFTPRSRRRKRLDWRLGGRAVSRWNNAVLSAALVGAGGGILAAGLVARLDASWAAPASSLILWMGLLAALGYALKRGRPAGLFAFRALDILFGVALGVLVRALQGALSAANEMPFPQLGGGAVSELSQAVGAGLAGPVVEELFFRAVLLVTVYQVLRRRLGVAAAAVTATLVSAGAFVCLHGAFSALSLADGTQLFAVGVVASSLVLTTGRIWSAVIFHITYNVLFLAIIGTGQMLS